VEKEAGPNADREIEQAYWMALSRAPSEEEKRVATQDLLKLEQAALKEGKGEAARQYALTAVCHTILNSAAFLYID
jgi:hypothetical protein